MSEAWFDIRPDDKEGRRLLLAVGIVVAGFAVLFMSIGFVAGALLA